MVSWYVRLLKIMKYYYLLYTISYLYNVKNSLGETTHVRLFPPVNCVDGRPTAQRDLTSSGTSILSLDRILSLSNTFLWMVGSGWLKINDWYTVVLFSYLSSYAYYVIHLIINWIIIYMQQQIFKYLFTNLILGIKKNVGGYKRGFKLSIALNQEV